MEQTNWMSVGETVDEGTVARQNWKEKCIVWKQTHGDDAVQFEGGPRCEIKNANNHYAWDINSTIPT